MPTAAAREVSNAFNCRAEKDGWPAVCDPTLAFRRPELATVLAIWRERAGEHSIPRRKDITHRCLRTLLPDVAIYERVALPGAEGRYRVRFIGTRFAQLMGDLTGKFLDEAIPDLFLPRWNAALDAALAAGEPLRFVSRSDTANKSYLVAEYFEAPLLDHNDMPNLILSAVHFACEASGGDLAFRKSV